MCYETDTQLQYYSLHFGSQLDSVIVRCMQLRTKLEKIRNGHVG